MSPDWAITLGKIVDNPRALKPVKVEVDKANNTTDYEYNVSPLSEVTLSVDKDSPARWGLGLISTESPVTSLATRAEKLCETGGTERFTWFELHGGPLGNAFAAVGAPDKLGRVHTAITSRLEMEAEKVRAERGGAPPSASIREELCSTH